VIKKMKAFNIGIPSLREQKQELLRQVNEAISKAPETISLNKPKTLEILEGKLYDLELNHRNSREEKQDYYNASAELYNATHTYMRTSKAYVTIGIPGGISYRILNRKEELFSFKNVLKSFPTNSTIKTNKVYSPPMPGPSAHKIEGMGPLFNIKQEGWRCDGHLAFKGDIPARATFTDNETALDMDHVMPRNTYPAQLLCYVFSDPEVGWGMSPNPIPRIMNGSKDKDGKVYYPYSPCVVFESQGEKTTYNQWLFSVIRNRFPDVVYEMSDEDRVLVARVDGEIVGLLMPFIVDYNIDDFLKGV